MKKILILGSSGLLGSNLYKILKNNFQVFHNGIKKRIYNIHDIDELNYLVKKYKPDLIINCVAITNIDFAEKNKKKTYNTNVKLIKNLIEIKKVYKFWLVHFSSDSFYNNKKKSRETSKKIFPNYYSKTKYLSDILARKHGLVLRTNFFGFSKNHKTFTDFIYESFLNKKKFYLFNDIFFSGIGLITLCKILKKILSNNWGASGVYNLGSRGCISKSKFGILFAKYLKIYNKNFKAINSKKILKVKRSNYMCMNVDKFEKEFKISLPNIKDELINEAKNYLKND